MPSSALRTWDSTGQAAIDDLLRMHAAATGAGPGRRRRTEQLNRGLFTTLVAQFQAYCLALHDLAVDTHAGEANPKQATLLRTLQTRDRKLTRLNPRTDHLGADFGLLGIPIVPLLHARGPRMSARLGRLDRLVDYRNAISHGNETEVAAIEADGVLRPRLDHFRNTRSMVRVLASGIDAVVARELSSMLDIDEPW